MPKAGRHKNLFPIIYQSSQNSGLKNDAYEWKWPIQNGSRMLLPEAQLQFSLPFLSNYEQATNERARSHNQKNMQLLTRLQISLRSTSHFINQISVICMEIRLQYSYNRRTFNPET